MVDNVIISQKMSPLISNLANSELEDYSYSLEPGAPLLANTIVSLQPQSTSSQYYLGNEIQFLVSQAYHLKSIMIRSQLTTGGSATNTGLGPVVAVPALLTTPTGKTPTANGGLQAGGTANFFTASTLGPDYAAGGSNLAIWDLYPKVGLRMYEYISITTSSGREICRFDSRYIRSWVESLPVSRAVEIYKKAMLLDPLNEQPIDYLYGSPLSPPASSTSGYPGGFPGVPAGTIGGTAGALGVQAGTQLVTYTPIPFFEVAEIKNYLDLGFCEQLIIRAKLQSTSAKMGFAYNEVTLPTFQTPNLQMTCVKFSEEYLRTLRNINFPPGSVLQIYNGNSSYTEVFLVPAQNNTITQRLNNTYPSSAMFVSVNEPVTQIALPIQSVALNVAGQVIYDQNASHHAEHSSLWSGWDQGGYHMPTFDPSALNDQVTVPSGTLAAGAATAGTNASLPVQPGPTKGGAFVLKAISNRAIPFVFNLEPGNRFKCTSAMTFRSLNGTTITVNLQPNSSSTPTTLVAPTANSGIPNYELAISFCTCSIYSIYADSGLIILSQLY